MRPGISSKAFTLLELIIVLALLAILASVAVVGFVDLSRKSIAVAEYTLISSFRSAVKLYYAKNATWPGWVNDNDLNTPGPFDLLENTPPNRNLLSMPNRDGDDIHWAWYQHSSAGKATAIELVCPHWGQNRGVKWFYIQSPGTLDGTELADCYASKRVAGVGPIWSAGQVYRCEWWSSSPAPYHCWGPGECN